MTATDTRQATSRHQDGPLHRTACQALGSRNQHCCPPGRHGVPGCTGAGRPLVVAGTGEVTLGNVTGFTIFGATVGAALAVAIGRFSRRPRPTFLAVTLIALAGYAVVPFTAAESIGTALWLNLFHLVVAVPVIGMLARWLPGDRTSVET